MTGGEAGQLEYITGGDDAASRTSNLGGTMRDMEEAAEFSNLRADAKRAHAERMVSLRNNDERASDAAAALADGSSANKPSAFKIAVSVANASDAADRMVCVCVCLAVCRCVMCTCVSSRCICV